jgi:hypothetical protein
MKHIDGPSEIYSLVAAIVTVVVVALTLILVGLVVIG